jgi:hypothetical protein
MILEQIPPCIHLGGIKQGQAFRTTKSHVLSLQGVNELDIHFAFSLDHLNHGRSCPGLLSRYQPSSSSTTAKHFSPIAKYILSTQSTVRLAPCNKESFCRACSQIYRHAFAYITAYQQSALTCLTTSCTWYSLFILCLLEVTTVHRQKIGVRSNQYARLLFI